MGELGSRLGPPDVGVIGRGTPDQGVKGVRGVVGVLGVVSDPPPVARFDGMDFEETVLFSAAVRRPRNMRDAAIDSMLNARGPSIALFFVESDSRKYSWMKGGSALSLVKQF